MKIRIACTMEVCLGVTLLTILSGITAAQQGYLNRNCNIVQECGEFGYLCGRNGTCQCSRWYIPNRTKDKCVGGVGQTCKYDEHCIEGAFCEHQAKCQCKDNLYSDDDGLACSRSEGHARPFLHYCLAIFLLTWRML